MITVKRFTADQWEAMERFCFEMKQNGMDNWASVEKMDPWGTVYFVAYYKGDIIAVNGLWKFGDEWVVFSRQATLPRYYALLVPSKKWGSGSIPTRFLALPSIEYALEQGATQLIATVNLDNSAGHNNNKNNKHADLMLRVGLWEYDGIWNVKHVLQDVYIINTNNFLKFLKDLQSVPVRIRDESN